MKFKIIDQENVSINFPHLAKITIYAKGKELYTIDQDYFQEYETRVNSYGHDIISAAYRGVPTCVYLNKPIKRANKLNLERKDNFYLNVYDRIWGKVQHLYIHNTEIGVEYLGERPAFETENEKSYLDSFCLIFKAGVTMENLHAEKIPCDEKWTIPDKGKWSECYGTIKSPCYWPYDTSKSHFQEPDKPIEKGVIKRWITEDKYTNYRMLTCQRYYTRTEFSETRKFVNSIIKTIEDNKLFTRIPTHYEIEALLKYYDITPKN